MKIHHSTTVTCAVAALLAGSGARAEAPAIPFDRSPEVSREPERPAIVQRPKPIAAARVATPAAEPATTVISNQGFATTSAFAAPQVPSPDATTLSPPVTITYAGASPALLINYSGTNKALESLLTNTGNMNSALFGETNGGGAGATGYNNGTTGPGGKFAVTNAASAQPGLTTTTNGTGEALLATITKVESSEPAILGQNLVSSGYGIGVEGNGNAYGVFGTSSTGTGVYGDGLFYGVWGSASTGYAVYGESTSGDGLFGYSSSGYGAYTSSSSGIGLYAFSESNDAISAVSDSVVTINAQNEGNGNAIYAHSAGGTTIYSLSDTGDGVWSVTKNHFAVIGADSGSGDGVFGSSITGLGVYGYSSGSGTGVYGYSAKGYAGYFVGKVAATSFATTSDRNAKSDIKPIDGRDILDRVDRLPIASWVFKSDPQKNHVGPMAQDFHAAFGLDGNDDKHINLTDMAGVSLAAIQELSKELQQQDAQMKQQDAQIKRQDAQMKIKDAEIAALQEQLKSMSDAFSARMTALERQQRSGVAAQTASQRKEAGAGVAQ